MSDQVVVTAFYKFAPLADARRLLAEQLREILGLKGLVILAPEGINGMAAGEAGDVEELKESLRSHPLLADLEFKDSYCRENPFPKWKVELKDQTIRYKEGFRPQESHHNHLSPSQWKALMEGEEPVTVLDTRNYYETRVGTFRGALDPKIDSFEEFADYLDRCDLPKDRKTLIFCTGGIRCEKAILDMEERGFEHVYQLQGGILKYLEEYPNEQFEGECFVFDSRVAVDQELAPSQRYALCPHCGDPGDREITCAHCGHTGQTCDNCPPLCSKNCAYHHRRAMAG